MVLVIYEVADDVPDTEKGDVDTARRLEAHRTGTKRLVQMFFFIYFFTEVFVRFTLIPIPVAVIGLKL